MNNVTLIGTLTRDPGEIVGKGAYLDLRVVEPTARRAEPLYIDVRVYGRQAEICQEYLTKGRQIAITGQLRPRELQCSESCGWKAGSFFIAAEHVDFLAPARVKKQPSTESSDV